MWPAPSAAPVSCKGHFHYAEKKGYSGVGLYTREDTQRGLDRLRQPRVRRRRPLHRKALRQARPQAQPDQLLLPQRQQRPRAPGSQVPFPRRHVPAPDAALKSQREFILVADVNIAHKEADLKNWKGNLKNSAVSCPRNAPGWTSSSAAARARAAWSMSTASCNPTPPTSATHGGATAARPMPRMWAGAWTTTSRRRSWPPWPSAPPSTKTRSSATMRR